MKKLKKLLKEDDPTPENVWELIKLIALKVFKTPTAEDEALMDMLDENTLAEKLKKHPRTIKNWAEAGDVPHYDINGNRYYKIGDIVKFIDSKKKVG